MSNEARVIFLLREAIIDADRRGHEHICFTKLEDYKTLFEYLNSLMVGFDMLDHGLHINKPEDVRAHAKACLKGCKPISPYKKSLYE